MKLKSSVCPPASLSDFIVLTGVAELLITSYYNITRRTMIDMVPKAIMLNLVQ